MTSYDSFGIGLELVKQKDSIGLITWLQSNPESLRESNNNEYYYENWELLLSEVLEQKDVQMIEQLNALPYVNFNLVFELSYSVAYIYDINIFIALHDYTKRWSKYEWQSCLKHSICANNLPLINHILTVYPYDDKQLLVSQEVINKVFEYCQESLWDCLKLFMDDSSEESCLLAAIEFDRVEYIEAYVRKYPNLLNRKYFNHACACGNAISLEVLIKHTDFQILEKVVTNDWLDLTNKKLNEIGVLLGKTPARFKKQHFIFKAIKENNIHCLNYLGNSQILNLSEDYDNEFEKILKELFAIHQQIIDIYEISESFLNCLYVRKTNDNPELFDMIARYNIKDTAGSENYDLLLLLKQQSTMLIENYHTPWITYKTPLEFAIENDSGSYEELLALGSEITLLSIELAKYSLKDDLQSRYNKIQLYRKINTQIQLESDEISENSVENLEIKKI